MFRAKLLATEHTDVAGELGALRRQASTKGLSALDIDQMEAAVGDVLQTFVDRGRAVAAAGSQMTVDRTVSDSGYKVQIHFQTGRASGGFLGRLRRFLGL